MSKDFLNKWKDRVNIIKEGWGAVKKGGQITHNVVDAHYEEFKSIGKQKEVVYYTIYATWEKKHMTTMSLAKDQLSYSPMCWPMRTSEFNALVLVLSIHLELIKINGRVWREHLWRWQGNIHCLVIGAHNSTHKQNATDFFKKMSEHSKKKNPLMSQ